MRRTAETHDRILWELNEERVAALRRISQTLEGLIVQLRSAGERLLRARPEERADAIAAYRALRERTLQYRWFLEVQRESMGLRQHHRLDEFYPIPTEVAVPDT